MGDDTKIQQDRHDTGTVSVLALRAVRLHWVRRVDIGRGLTQLLTYINYRLAVTRYLVAKKLIPCTTTIKRMRYPKLRQ